MASWYEAWAGAGAVEAMCARRGMAGISTGQGESIGAVTWREAFECRHDCL